MEKADKDYVDLQDKMLLDVIRTRQAKEDKSLLTENKTITGAINELFNMIKNKLQ